MSIMTTDELEIEIKVKIESVDEMKGKLEAVGATFDCKLVHEDYYLDLPLKLGSFMQTDEALRIRVSKDETHDVTKEFITYKGKKLDATTKTRSEIEVGVENGKQVRDLFVQLGFREVIMVKKYRNVYKHENISITVDEVEHLEDPYMEVEIIGKKENLDENREKLFIFLDKLGIDKSRSERRSYLELILESLGIIRSPSSKS